MDLKFLRTLRLVAEVGSMAEAARRLGISAPAVTQQLRALEADLGVRLVVRAGRSVVPTVAGRRLLDNTRSLLAQVEMARASVYGSAMVGELRVGTINTALHSFLPDVLAGYSAAHPEARIKVNADLSPALFEQLQEDRIDLAICQHPPFDLSKAFGWALLQEFPLVLLAPAEFAECDAETLLRSQPFVRYDRNLAGGQQADLYLRGKGITVQERCELDSLLAIGLMVHKRLGVSLLPQFQSLLTAPLEIIAMQLPDAPAARSFGLLWKTATPKIALIKAFIAFSQQAIR